MEHFLSSNSSVDLRSDTHQSQIIGGDADEDHTQIMGGISPHPFRVLAPLTPWIWQHNRSVERASINNLNFEEPLKPEKVFTALNTAYTTIPQTLKFRKKTQNPQKKQKRTTSLSIAKPMQRGKKLVASSATISQLTTNKYLESMI